MLYIYMKITYMLLKLISNHSNCLELRPDKGVLNGRVFYDWLCIELTEHRKIESSMPLSLFLLVYYWKFLIFTNFIILYLADNNGLPASQGTLFPFPCARFTIVEDRNFALNTILGKKTVKKCSMACRYPIYILNV